MIKSMKSGFTLAEVLTTLMVIGVVAAMTIPTLMNSTNDQQAKVACKKAASVLSQAAQLMVAKEIECTSSGNTGDDANNDLMNCMAQVMSGTTDSTNHTLTTADGMVYQFFAPNSTKFVSLEDTCKDTFGDLNGKGNCAVVVDTNGFSKGTKGSSGKVTSVEFGSDGFATSPEAANDVAAFSLSSSGAKPMAIRGGNDTAAKYMYGNVSYDQILCCEDSSKCGDDTDNKGKYTKSQTTTSSSCSKGYTSCSASDVVTKCSKDTDKK